MAYAIGDERRDPTSKTWEGCAKVGAGCAYCYAESLASKRLGFTWGSSGARSYTPPSLWQNPIRWNQHVASGASKPRWVFCGSLADVFDSNVPSGWRSDLFALIAKCPNLRWTLCTKSLDNVPTMVRDWRWFIDNPQVGLLVKVVNQEDFDRDAPRLVQLKAEFQIRWVGLLVEPQLGLIDPDPDILEELDWVVTGGESGPQARPFNMRWATWMRDKCREVGTPWFMKQAGARPFMDTKDLIYRDRTGGDPMEWPPALRVREMPVVYERAT